MAPKSGRAKTSNVLKLDDKRHQRTYTISLDKKRTATKISISTKKKHKNETPKSNGSKVSQEVGKAMVDSNMIKKSSEELPKDMRNCTISKGSIENIQQKPNLDVEFIEDSSEHFPAIRLVKLINKNKFEKKPSFVVLNNLEVKESVPVEAAEASESVAGNENETETTENEMKTSEKDTDQIIVRNKEDDRVSNKSSNQSVGSLQNEARHIQPTDSNSKDSGILEQSEFLKTHLKAKVSRRLFELSGKQKLLERKRKIQHVQTLDSLKHIIPQEFIAPRVTTLPNRNISRIRRRNPALYLRNTPYFSCRTARRHPLAFRQRDVAVNTRDDFSQSNRAESVDEDCAPTATCSKSTQPSIASQSIVANINTNGMYLPPKDVPQPILTTSSCNDQPTRTATVNVVRNILPILTQTTGQDTRNCSHFPAFSTESQLHIPSMPSTVPNGACYMPYNQSELPAVAQAFNSPPSGATNMQLPPKMQLPHFMINSCGKCNKAQNSADAVWPIKQQPSFSIQHPQGMPWSQYYGQPNDQTAVASGLENTTQAQSLQFQTQLPNGFYGGNVMTSLTDSQMQAYPQQYNDTSPVNNTQNYPNYYEGQMIRPNAQSKQGIQQQSYMFPQLFVGPGNVTATSPQFTYSRSPNQSAAGSAKLQANPSRHNFVTMDLYNQQKAEPKCTCYHCLAASNLNRYDRAQQTSPRPNYPQQQEIVIPPMPPAMAPTNHLSPQPTDQNTYFVNRLSSGAYANPTNNAQHYPNQYLFNGGMTFPQTPPTSPSSAPVYYPANGLRNTDNMPHYNKVTKKTSPPNPAMAEYSTKSANKIQLVSLFPSFITMNAPQDSKPLYTAPAKQKQTEPKVVHATEQRQGILNLRRDESVKSRKTILRISHTNEPECHGKISLKSSRKIPPPVPPKRVQGGHAKISRVRNFPSQYCVRFAHSCLLLRAIPHPVSGLSKRVSRYTSVTAWPTAGASSN